MYRFKMEQTKNCYRLPTINTCCSRVQSLFVYSPCNQLKHSMTILKQIWFMLIGSEFFQLPAAKAAHTMKLYRTVGVSHQSSITHCTATVPESRSPPQWTAYYDIYGKVKGKGSYGLIPHALINLLATKTIQISRMGDVYGQADKVHVWLGESSPADNINQIINLLQAIAVVQDESFNADRYFESLDRHKKVLIADQIVNNSMHQFLSRPCSRRRWVVQEVILGHDITARYVSLKIP
ncbi:hypothetical protein B0J11DRAFT_300081 [Dendryphion nanum]|uniref:Heterokaryon incompatibility domain-containing protein n=1 Tax=Dendryphion nanum TaxID=256645 RepID=A0A9P9DSM2_9PLEO|nr:hypothetical protein B0J11DRAFT_300081 [Dendryphion nanum]